jgi:hypothetical protein
MQSDEQESRADHEQAELEQRGIPRALEIVPSSGKLEGAESFTRIDEDVFAPPLNGYDDFGAPLLNVPNGDFGSIVAVNALDETLESAKQVVEAILEGSAQGHPASKTPYWARVAECEEKTADLLQLLVRLRRGLQEPRGPILVTR